MTTTLTHPTRSELARCAVGAEPDDSLLAQVRRHLEEDRCDECSAAVFDILSSSGRPMGKSPLTRRWVRPVRVGASGGTRVGAAADYQLVCTAGPFALDVLVRDCEAERELRFVGQVTHAGRIHEPVPELPLQLIGMPVASTDDTATDEFGEFALSSGRDGLYGLRLGPTMNAPCVMVWEGWDA